MARQQLNTICFAICIVCIVAGVVLSTSLIWSNLDDVLLWKALMTVGVFFFAAALTMSVNRMLDKPR